MKRTERERIIEDIIMTDPMCSCDDDYQHFTLEECEVQLTETRKYNNDFNPEDRVPDDMTAAEVKETWDRIVNEYWQKKNAFNAIPFKELPQEVPQGGPGPHERNMGVICQFIEAFEDFLDEKGIVIPNDEKDEDPYASNIYGTDYGNLSDSIEELLRAYNVLEKED